VGLGVWEGSYQGVKRQWLRWYDGNGHWLPTPEEKTEAEKQRADKLAAKLLALGVDLEFDNE
jgi:hypothetical protein